MANPLKAALLCLMLPAAAAAQDHAGRFYTSGPSTGTFFALTYDDGPGATTPALLDLLASKKAKATFFINGSPAGRHLETLRRACADGHLAANHTYAHRNYFKLAVDPDREKILAAELEPTEKAIEKACGYRPRLMRMPNGYSRDWVKKVARARGYALANWTYGSDWTKLSDEEMTAGYLKALKPGAILLFHDGGGKVRERTLRLTRAVLDEAEKRGLQPVTLDKLLNIGDAKPVPSGK
ncbi:MAG: polysaccharide deacetylase family protein [Elusimicrobiales bacterium]|jgi:peptidoglycan/xylan/chitin deacetylase (PgdA/CDA1 family)|nr:polysaccharide deacetylase family protein [Elusimicrobiales bacterium]